TEEAKARGIKNSLSGEQILPREGRRGRRQSVQPNRLVRTVERKGRNGDRKALAAFGLHLVGAGHDPRRGRERRAAGIFEALARGEYRLLADDAGAAHFLNLAAIVGDLPIA